MMLWLQNIAHTVMQRSLVLIRNCMEVFVSKRRVHITQLFKVIFVNQVTFSVNPRIPYSRSVSQVG